MPSGIHRAWPVGALFLSAVPANPAQLLGFGTWQAFGAGRVLVGLDAAQTEFDALGKTGGAKTHTLGVTEMPSHTHVQNAHAHGEQLQGGTTGATTGTHVMGSTATGGSLRAAGQSTVSATAVNQSTGGGGAHNNLQPFIVVNVWQRTA